MIGRGATDGGEKSADFASFGCYGLKNMRITAIKEGDYLRIIASSAPIPEDTPMNLFIVGIDAWDAAQLESVFRDDEDWGHSLDYLIVKKAH